MMAIKKLLARLVQIAGFLGIAISFLLFNYFDADKTINNNTKDYWTFLWMATFGLSSIIFFIGKRLYTSVVNRYASDKRRPVLYLRNFKADSRAARGRLNWILRLSFFGGNIFSDTEEEQLAEVMSNYGPFIGIGKPGELLPRLGASRIYVDNDSWKGKVHSLIKDSRLVVIRASNSAGLMWELDTVVNMKPLEDIIIVIPDNQAEYSGFADRFFSIRNVHLPDIVFNSKSLYTFRGIIWFDESGLPHAETCKSSSSWLDNVIIFGGMLRMFRNCAAAELTKLLQANKRINNLEINYVRPVAMVKRLAAFLLDCLFIAATLYLLYLLIPADAGIFRYVNKLDHQVSYDPSNFFIALCMIYLIGFEIMPPYATPGKRIMRIYVNDEIHMKPMIMQSVGRLSIKMLEFGLLVGIYWVIRGKRMPHDFLTKTDVFGKKTLSQ